MKNVFALLILLGHFLALGEAIVKIFEDGAHYAAVIRQDGALELLIEATQIHIDGADNGGVLRQDELGMHKGILHTVEADAERNKLFRVVARNAVDEGFIGDARENDTDVDP